MHDLPTLAGVFGLSSAKFMMGVALGVGLRLPFVVQVLCTGGGAVVGIFVTAYLGDGIRALVRRRFPAKPKPPVAEGDPPPKTPLAVRVWDKWGLAGLAIIGPITLGPVVAVVTAISLGAPRSKVITFMTVTTLVWSVVFGAFSALAPGLLPTSHPS